LPQQRRNVRRRSIVTHEVILSYLAVPLQKSLMDSTSVFRLPVRGT
jgi:hypothetical protein